MTDWKKVSLGLGVFSIVLGTVEVFAGKRIARALDAEDHSRLVRGFGAREWVAGVSLVMSPAHSTNVWNRVAGDAMDLTALALAARNAPRNGLIWGALAFVGAVTVLDVVTARGLDATTGRMLPSRRRP